MVRSLQFSRRGADNRDETMTLTPTELRNGTRRVVLIDFDWHDADLIPELLKQPGISVRLVAGERNADPGVRVAELCSLPRTCDLADLTREIFDLALVGERSSRRTQLESLLLALGTPCQTPQAFLRGPGAPEPAPAIEAPLALHAAAFESVMGGGDLDQLVQDAFADLGDGAPTRPRPVVVSNRPRLVITSLDDFPSPEDRARLELALKDLVFHTGAGTAELHAVAGDRKLHLVAQVGPEDRLLKGLVDLAVELGTPQVVTRLSEPQKGKAWGAWPFRTAQRRGVLAAASIDPGDGWAQWQKMVEDLRVTWDAEDLQRAGASFPLTPDRETGWLDREAFRACLELAVERNRRDRLRFELHRLDFPPGPEAFSIVQSKLPAQVRDTDSLHRSGDRTVLLLSAAETEHYAHLRRRLLALWDSAWREAKMAPPAPALVDQFVDMNGPEDAEAFLAVAQDWLSA